MRENWRGAVVLVGFVALVAAVVGAFALLWVAEDKALAATVVGTVVALLAAATKVAFSLAATWRDLPRTPSRPVATAVGAIAVVAVVAVSATWASSRGDDTGTATGGLDEVLGIVGSEKSAFFEDPAVVEAFADHGLDVTVEPRGSRAMAADGELAERFDFAFPASVADAVRIRERLGVDQDTVTPFGSPLVIASFDPVVDVLATAGVARREADGTWTFDMEAFVGLAAEGRTWDDLAPAGYSSAFKVLVRTTDPWSSASGAMYLAVADRVAAGLAERGRLPGDAAATVGGLVVDQGLTGPTTEEPFAAYTTRGIEAGPLVYAYEAQYLEAAAGGGLGDDRALLYPSPTIVARHTLVPLSDDGGRVGDLIESDATLRQLARRHGFRTGGGLDLAGDVAPGVRADLGEIDTVDPPTFEALEGLLETLAGEYRRRGLEPPVD